MEVWDLRLCRLSLYGRRTLPEGRHGTGPSSVLYTGRSEGLGGRGSPPGVELLEYLRVKGEFPGWRFIVIVHWIPNLKIVF